MKSAEVLFGEEVKKSRVLRGLTQEDLAHEAEVHPTYVSQLERGLKSPSLRVMLQLADALGVPASELVQAVEKRLPRPKK